MFNKILKMVSWALFLADLDYPREKVRPLMRSQLSFINF